jgi:hypothetical protein
MDARSDLTSANVSGSLGTPTSVSVLSKPFGFGYATRTPTPYRCSNFRMNRYIRKKLMTSSTENAPGMIEIAILTSIMNQSSPLLELGPTQTIASIQRKNKSPIKMTK